MLTGILPQSFLQTSPSTTSFHRKQQVNSKETTRDASCYRSQPNVVFWRWKDLYTITELPSFPVPRVCFQGKQNLFQITPDIFFPAQQLHLRMFSRCLCLYETYNNKIVNRRRQYPDCKKELPGKAWKLTSPHTKPTCSHQWDDEDLFYWPFWRTTTFLCKWAHKICPVSPVASGGLFVFGEQIPCTWADGVWNNVKPNCNYSEKKENVILWSASFEKKQKRRKSLQQVKSEVVETDLLHEGSKISWPEVRPPISSVLKPQRVPNESALPKTSAEWNVCSVQKLSNTRRIKQEFETGSLFSFIFWNCFSFSTGLCWLRERTEQAGSES